MGSNGVTLGVHFEFLTGAGAGKPVASVTIQPRPQNPNQLHRPGRGRQSMEPFNRGFSHANSLRSPRPEHGNGQQHWNILSSSISKQCLDCRPPLWQRGPPPRRGLRFHRLAGCEDVSVVESDWLILLVVLWIPYSLCVYIYIYMCIYTHNIKYI